MLVDHMKSRSTWDLHLVVLHPTFPCRRTGSRQRSLGLGLGSRGTRCCGFCCSCLCRLRGGLRGFRGCFDKFSYAFDLLRIQKAFFEYKK
jgi:hypothetical protein